MEQPRDDFFFTLDGALVSRQLFCQVRRKLRIVGVLVMFSAIPVFLFWHMMYRFALSWPAICLALGGFAMFVAGAWSDS
jgi:hypothetical protein